ncbi:glycosyltransferase [Cyclobacterium sp. 1_MG-2023]|uniref:glycosyltransferase n=1 Tax=Cyclobacterium sp. 1_MG-2023 TaxID=3062681 RepID=UPI0026E4395C|nr:glycosyltransferase [Cyclobacterium sp. 1_MG-2023]MDO6439160.1 glycosyltransferase [Cyclobacterium sp. 1_MG-2023]
MKLKDNNPLVSVCMITYNHANYIKKAIIGVLDQKYAGDIELVILNDKSPDDTDSKVLEIIEKYDKNNVIRYFKNDENLGVMSNFYKALNLCRGKYIALCEGDDFWTDSNKLAIQIQFLEKNESYSFSFHKACKVKNENDDTIFSVFPIKSKTSIIKVKEFFRMGGKATSSIVFRNKIDFDIIKINHSHGDFLLYLKFFEIGNGIYIDQIMSSYRGHIHGISFNKGSIGYQKKRIQELYEEYELIHNNEIKDQIKYQIVFHIFHLILQNKSSLSKDDLIFYLSKILVSKHFYSIFLTFMKRWILIKVLLNE